MTATTETKLCVNCHFYQEGATEHDDKCLHPKATLGGVRGTRQASCGAMVASVCLGNKLWQAPDTVKTEVKPIFVDRSFL